MVRVLAIPIIVFWGLFAISTNTFVPQVERVAEELAGPQVPHYAPSQRALLHIGEKFHESNSTSLTMVVLEADRPLDDEDHRYYDDLMRRLKRDTKHVQYVMDLWGKPITAAGAQSVDGKATYVLLRLGWRYRPNARRISPLTPFGISSRRTRRRPGSRSMSAARLRWPRTR